MNEEQEQENPQPNEEVIEEVIEEVHQETVFIEEKVVELEIQEQEEECQKADQGSMEPEQASVQPSIEYEDNQSRAIVEIEEVKQEVDDEPVVVVVVEEETQEEVQTAPVALDTSPKRQQSQETSPAPARVLQVQTRDRDEQRGSSSKKEVVVEYRVKGSGPKKQEQQEPVNEEEKKEIEPKKTNRTRKERRQRKEKVQEEPRPASSTRIESQPRQTRRVEGERTGEAPRQNRSRSRQQRSRQQNGTQQKKEPRAKTVDRNQVTMADKRSKYSNQYETYECKRKFNSKYDEYQYGEWRFNKPRVFVTPETQVPEVPKTLFQEPDDVAYHMAQVKLDDQIEELNNNVNDYNKQFNDILAQLQDNPDAGRTARRELSGELQSQFKEQKIYINKKNEIRKNIEVIDKQILEVEGKIRFKSKTVHQVYNKLNLIEKGVSELEKRMSTSTLDRQTEQQLLKEIQRIKASRPALEEIETFRNKISEFRNQKSKMTEGFPEMNAILKCIREEIDLLKNREGTMDDQQSVLQTRLDTVKEQRASMKNKFAKLRAQKAELKEDHYEQLITYEKQQQLIHDISWLNTTKVNVSERAEKKKVYDQERQKQVETRKKYQDERKTRLDEQEKKKKERQAEYEEKKKAQVEEKLTRLSGKNPYSEEITQAQQLLNFCEKNKIIVESNGSSVVEAETGTQDDRSKKMEEALSKGKLIQEESKHREEQDFIEAASKQQGKRDKKRVKDFPNEIDPNLKLDLHLIMKFGRLGISPPVKRSELEQTAEQVSDIMDALSVLGQLEQEEGKSRLSGDKSYVQTEEYNALQKRHKNQNEETLKRLQQIKEEKKRNWAHVDDDEDDYDDIELGSPALPRQGESTNQRSSRGKRDREFEGDRRGGSFRGGRGGRGARRGGGEVQGNRQQNNQRVRFDQIRNETNHFPSF